MVHAQKTEYLFVKCKYFHFEAQKLGKCFQHAKLIRNYLLDVNIYESKDWSLCVSQIVSFEEIILPKCHVW